LLNGEALVDAPIKIPLKTLNRHGLIGGATGTEKTKTIQVFSEQLSLLGIPVLMMDIKGNFCNFLCFIFQERNLSLEPCHRICISDFGSLFYFLKIVL